MNTLSPLTPALTGDSGTDAFLRDLASQGLPHNTRAAIAAALRYWAAWYMARHGTPLELASGPLPTAVALTFVADHAVIEAPDGPRTAMPADVDAALVSLGAKRRLGPLSYATWHQRLVLMTTVHRLLGWASGTAAPEVLELVRRAKRPAAKLGYTRGRARALLREDVQAMVATCGDDFAGIRDRALLSVAFASGGRRRSELAGMTIEDLQWRGGGDGEPGYLISLWGGKGRAPGQERPKPVRGEAALSLARWLSVLASAGICAGPLFRIVRGNTKPTIGKGLSAHAVNAIVQRRGRLAGLEGPLSAHGLRGGFLTQAHRDGVDLHHAMALSDHRDLKTVREHYLAEVDAFANPAGKLMG